jgi:hypothetical protein
MVNQHCNVPFMGFLSTVSSFEYCFVRTPFLLHEYQGDNTMQFDQELKQ